MPAMTALLQTISLIGSVLIVAVAVGVAWRWREARPFVVMPAVWAVFGAVYYALVLADRFTPAALLLWGAVHRLLAVVMVLGAVLTLWAVMAAPPPEQWPQERDEHDDA